MDRLLWYVFAGSRGGPTRVRIVESLIEAPMNTNQLANALGMDYKTIDYQLRVLQKHTYVVTHMEGYGRAWEPSKNLLAAINDFRRVAAGQRPGRSAPAGDLGKETTTPDRE